MENETYRLTFFLNATHIVTIDGKDSSIHPHTFEINCFIKSQKFTAFEIMENSINQILNQLNNQYLNELEAFKNIVPTLENLTRLLYRAISANLGSVGCKLVELEVAESPVRTFIIKEN